MVRKVKNGFGDVFEIGSIVRNKSFINIGFCGIIEAGTVGVIAEFTSDVHAIVEFETMSPVLYDRITAHVGQLSLY